jgi:hypothetical protein
MWEETEEVIPDKQELLEFIKTITHKSSSEKFYSLEEIETWKGDRDMIDLWDLLKKYYYNPLTNGSNSIKQVLPSILNIFISIPLWIFLIILRINLLNRSLNLMNSIMIPDC